VPLAPLGQCDVVNPTRVSRKLADALIPHEVISEVLAALPTRAFGIVLYGSVARGDSSSISDIDLLLISDDHETTRAVGRVNITTYDEDQFRSADGTIFGMHVARDGLVLHDAGGVAKAINLFGGVDVLRVERRLAELASLLDLPEAERRLHLPGFIRHARYVLRTAIYLAALKAGQPCFSVGELAERAGDPGLVNLLSSHPVVQGEPTWELLEELRHRVRSIAPPSFESEFETLHDAIVGLGAAHPDVSDAAVMILNRRSSDPYAVIPRVIL
jgi:predicted nucleotidyltransferase